MTFGERIVYYRKRQNITQKELAEMLGITPTRLNYWEKDKREPDIKMINAICAALNIDGDALLGRCDKNEMLHTLSESNSGNDNSDPNLSYIIECYNEMNPEGKNQLVAVARAFKESGMYDKHSNIPLAVNEKIPQR